MEHALASLDARGVRSVRLDATPLGQPIYEKLGFAAEYTLARYDGVLSASEAPTQEVRAVEPDDVEECFAHDEAATRTDRSRLLNWLYSDHPEGFRFVELGGFLASRPGTNAVQVGPCIAMDPDAGRALLADACRRLAGERVFLDVPLPNTEAVRAVEALGLTVQRHLLRMGRGEPVLERVELLWTSFGPELG
jgi:hypothetical protein